MSVESCDRQIKRFASKSKLKLKLKLAEMATYNKYSMRDLLLTPSLLYLFVVAFVHMARNLETYYDPDGMPLIAADGTRLNVSEELRPSQLSSAVTEFSKFEVSVSTLSSESTLSSDPWIHCPACAVTDRTSLNDGKLYNNIACTILFFSNRKVTCKISRFVIALCFGNAINFVCRCDTSA